MGSDKDTRKHHNQQSQGDSPFPASDHRAARNKQDSIIKINMKHKKEAAPWNDQQKNTLEGLNIFKCTNLTLSSDVYQDT